MNISHRSLWNASLGAWVAVSEITRASGPHKLRGIASVKTRLTFRLCPLGAALVLASLLVTPGSGFAQSTDWSAGTGGAWSTGGNWTSGAPTIATTARLTNAGDEVTLSTAGTAQALEVQGSGEVIVGAGGSLVVGDIINLGTAGGAGVARLTIQAGGTVSATHLFAGDAPRLGIVTVTGAGSSFTLAPTGLGQAQRFEIGGNGAGELHIDAGANVTVNGTRTLHMGDTANGTLFIGGGAGAGTLTADSVILGTAGSSVQFNHTGVTTFSAAVSGNGLLAKSGTGTTILTGANTYSGGTSVTAGSLQGNTTSLQGNITNHADVTFDQASAGTYAGTMSGTGVLTKLGVGHLILSGINLHGGGTNIHVGTLSVNGSVASATTIHNGGALGGVGSVGTLNVLGGGTLAPGNAIGMLTVNGSATFAAGSVYRVEVDAAGNNDRLNVNGSAAILGGTVDVQASAGTYAANTTYTILHATGGRTGTFANVTSNLAFLTPTLGYNANQVLLTLARNDISFASVAATPNQIATSTALQNAGGSGDLGAVQTALTGQTAAQARAAYDSASGAGLVALRRAGLGFAAGFNNQLLARLGAVRGGGSSTRANAFANGPVLLAANDHVSDLMAPVSGNSQKFSLAEGASSSLPSANDAAGGLWLRGSGSEQNTRSDGNAAANRLRGSHLSLGFDADVGEGLRAGAALSGGTSRLSTDNDETGRSRGTAVALYGSYASGPWNFNGSASLAHGRNRMERNVIVGAIHRTAVADFDSTTLSAYGEATYTVSMQGGWAMQPLAALSLGRSKADRFAETGAGSLNLQSAGHTTQSTKSLIGAKASFDTRRIRFEPRAIWAHEFGDLNAPMTAQFQGAANASPFQISGVALKRDTLILGLGVSGSVGKGLDLFADVQVGYNARQRNLALLAGLRSRW